MASAGRTRHRSKLVARGGGKQRGIGTAGLLQFADLRELRDLLPGVADDDDENDEADEELVEGAANEDQYSEQVSYGRDADDETEDDFEYDWQGGEALDRPGLWVEPEPAIVIDRYGSRLVARPASSGHAVEVAEMLRAIGQYLVEQLEDELMTGDVSALDHTLIAGPLSQVNLVRWLREHRVRSTPAAVSRAVKGIVVRVHGAGRIRLSWFLRGDARREGVRESAQVTALRAVIQRELAERPSLTTAVLAEVARRQLGGRISEETVRRHRNKIGLAAQRRPGRGPRL